MSLDATVLEGANLTEEELRNSVIDITKKVFSTMVMLDVKEEPPQMEQSNRFHSTVTSMVGLAGAYSGIISVHCPIALAKVVTSNMLGVDVADICDDVNDAMGEIANMLGGDIKHLLSKGGMDINLSTPTVIYGDDYTIDFISDEHNLTVSFTCMTEEFIVGLKLDKE